MSHTDLSFAFAQARLQARFGARPSVSDWNHIEATADLAATLQVVRNTTLARWTARLGAHPDVHDIEVRLRDEWALSVDEVAGWQPAPWRAAIAWLRWIVYLPALQKLARGGRAPDWMRPDPVLGPVVAREPRERAAALQRTPIAALAAGFGPEPDVAGAWSQHWRELWPADGAAAAALDAVLRETEIHRQRLASLPSEARSADATQTFVRRLRLFFRRNPLSPAAAVAYLGLLAVDLRRLRGLLAVRAVREQAVAAS